MSQENTETGRQTPHGKRIGPVSTGNDRESGGRQIERKAPASDSGDEHSRKGAMTIEQAIEVFVRGFTFTRSFTYPYQAEQVEGAWVMRDAYRPRGDYR